MVGEFARVITFKTEYAQSLIDRFYLKESAPHIAISVDMLDTGIDVPEAVNLVFFKLVRSKTKFWQMMGRGTRLCPNLFGPGEHKAYFQVFDYCQNLEFFSEDPDTTDGPSGEPLGKRLFKARLELICELDAIDENLIAWRADEEMVDQSGELRRGLATRLHEEVEAMNLDNFIVRPQRRLVEKYREAGAWEELRFEERAELADEVAGLPHELDPEDEQAKRFDLLLLNLQLAVLKKEPSFARLRKQVVTIAGLLEERSAIPMVQKQLVIIQELQTDEWWEHATLTMLETVRRRLRDLVSLIEMKARKPVFTDFEDELGESTEVQFLEFISADEFERFRAKARHFLAAHLDHLVVHKLRMNEPLTAVDLAELERLLGESGVGSEIEIKQAREQSEGLGLFVRSLVGLDREAAKQALGRFLDGGTATASQIEFLDLIVDHLTEYGALSPARLYESPFIDVAAGGPESCFAANDVEELCSILGAIRDAAAG